MFNIITEQQYKPNRLDYTNDQKDEKYHLRYGRWVIGEGINRKQAEHIKRYKRNLKFYKGDQWIMEEDLEAFFKDESGMDRNRIKVIRNYIQPMVEYYRGNAKRMSFDISAYSISPMAKSRKDLQLTRLLTYYNASLIAPEFGKFLKDQGYPMGNTEEETRDRFEKNYVDEYVLAINRLLRYVAHLNDLDRYVMNIAVDIACGGMSIMKPYPYNGEWRFERIPIEQFGWDRSAIEPDLSDAEYFFEFKYMIASTLFEMFPNIKSDVKKAIENYTIRQYHQNIYGMPFITGSRIPVYTAVWRDINRSKFGYVIDKFGQKVLEMIDYVYEGEDKPRYTKKDVLKVSTLSPREKKILGDKDTKVIDVDLWRYCVFIPHEILSIGSNDKVNDIVLDYGYLPYQEPDLYLPTNMRPPYKVGIWSYIDGEVLSPVDVVINPQRMINRFLSVIEGHVNNSGGSGPLYDRDLMGDEEDEINIRMKRGEPVGIHARGRGVNNAVGRYDAGIKDATVIYSQLIENFKQGIEDITLVNEGLKGQTNNPDQLVGVMQLMIQRGSITQEPFYSAIENIYKGCYQSIATSGRRYYIDMDVELNDAVGEESAEVIKLSKDYRNENFRVFLKRSMDRESERIIVDQKLMLWLQYGLMDHETVSNLIGRATEEEAHIALRNFTKKISMLKRKAEAAQADITQQQAQAQQQAGTVLYGEKLREEARESAEKDKDRATKVVTAVLKNNK